LELSWMGRYRNLVRALVHYSNSSNKFVGNTGSANNLNQYQYQILEYICEHEDENKIMTDIARDLGVLKSVVTKETKYLCERGFVAKYRIVGNRKSIVLKPTEEGRQAYLASCKIVEKAFEHFFDTLSNASVEELKLFELAVDALSAAWNEPIEPELEEI